MIWVYSLPKVTAEIETGMAKNPALGPANRRRKLGLAWRNRKKVSQIINAYLYLPFFLLIIFLDGHSKVCNIMLPTLGEKFRPIEENIEKKRGTSWLNAVLRQSPTGVMCNASYKCKFYRKGILRK
jgi:hypothetical protein